jgi:2-methylisocitrate lyase-like PEP mutase family enzyme
LAFWNEEGGAGMNFGKVLRGYLEREGKMVVAPGAYDGISARLIAAAGFEVAYMTGAGISASGSGLPDIGLTTLTEMVTSATMIVESTQLPVIADADTGFGNPLNMIRTVRGYERANVAAIQIEDQVFPKRCGHLGGKQVIPAEEFIEKIKAAVDSRTNPDFLIIARTDARAVYGLDEAISRANLYVEAGADIAFVEAPESVEELQKIPKSVKAPCLVNMVGPGSRTPAVPTGDLEDMGFKIAIYAPVCFMAAVQAMVHSLGVLKKTGIGWDPSYVLTPEDFFNTMGMEKWRMWENKISK